MLPGIFTIFVSMVYMQPHAYFCKCNKRLSSLPGSWQNYVLITSMLKYTDNIFRDINKKISTLLLSLHRRLLKYYGFHNIFCLFLKSCFYDSNKRCSTLLKFTSKNRFVRVTSKNYTWTISSSRSMQWKNLVKSNFMQMISSILFWFLYYQFTRVHNK